MSSNFKVILIFFVHCIMLNHSAIAMQPVKPVPLTCTELIFTKEEVHCIRGSIQTGNTYTFINGQCQNNDLIAYFKSLRENYKEAFSRVIGATIASEYPNLAHAFLLYYPGIQNDYVCVTDKERTTPAMVAARFGRPETLQRILMFPQNLELPAMSIDSENQEGNTAFAFACKNGHDACARLLLQAGANPCALNKNGNLAISFAISFRHTEILHLFAEYYQTDPALLAKIINQQDSYKKNALMWAAWHGHADIVFFLLDHGADPFLTFERNERNQENKALDWAYRGKTKMLHENWGQGTLESYNAIIKMLISYKRQQEMPTIITSTSLNNQPTLIETTSTAELYKQIPPDMQTSDLITIIFTNEEADCIAKTLRGNTPYYFMNGSFENKNLQEYLASLPNPSETLCLAIKSSPITEHQNLVWALLLVHPDLLNTFIVTKETTGETPIMMAARWGKLNTLQVILSMHPSLELQADNNEGNTALTFAAKNGHAECAHLLLRAGVNPLNYNKLGNLPLCLAAGFGQTEVIQAFIDFYRDYPDYWAQLINTPDVYYKNALMWATRMGRLNTVKLLLHHDANPYLVFELDRMRTERRALHHAMIGCAARKRGFPGYGLPENYQVIIALLQSYEATQQNFQHYTYPNQSTPMEHLEANSPPPYYNTNHLCFE